MSRAIRADYNQRFLLPPSLEDWVPAQHPARFVRDLVEVLDLAAEGFTSSEDDSDEGRPHYAPDLLLKVWLFGWMERTRSSRALERACLRDVAFLWLTGNHHPDHNTLWRFFRAHRKPLRRLFKRVVRLAADAGLVGWALHALDGTKLPAASSMDSALHKQKLQEQLKRIDALIDAEMKRIEQTEAQDEGSYALPTSLCDAKARKAAIVEALERLKAEETDHLHPREPDARMVKTRTHVTLGYNAQAVVDHDSDLIVAADVAEAPNDSAELVEMTEQARENTGRVAEAVVADAGYFDGEQIAEAEKRRLPVLVASHAEDEGAYAKARFEFDAERDEFVCPLGERLTFERVEHASKGKPYDRRVYRCHKRDCAVRDACSKNKKGRTVKRADFDDAMARQKARNSGVLQRIALSLRKEVVEHLFGCLKANDGFRRFTMRGSESVRAQWSLLCTAFNLRKLYAHWRVGRLQLKA